MAKALDCAMRLLTRRDHGLQELTQKLVRKGHEQDASEEAVLACQDLGLQSDTRFVESFCRLRIRQGYGPARISQELNSKHIDRELITTVLQTYQEDWEEHALAVWQKKFKQNDKPNAKELQKQHRFLLYRGFYAETIKKILK
jgi:regulatory protein